MKGFIVATGRSGTKWAATALRQCCHLDARHESMRYEPGRDFGGVEVNGNLWRQTQTLRRRFPEAAIVHQVRDGRDVVRSILSCGDAMGSFERACRRWASRNLELAFHIPSADRFRLEDLTTDFLTFSTMAMLLGAESVSWRAWDRIRGQRINSRQRRFPAYADWSPDQRAYFWQVCGELMDVLGYPNEERGHG